MTCELPLPGVTCSAVLTVRIDSSFKLSATSSIRAFVILFDEKLANTALLFEGLDICGRRLRLRRPRECSECSSEAFDVSTLYRLGMLSREPEEAPDAPKTSSRGPAGATSKAAAKPPRPRPNQQGLRHLYIGNLPERHSSLQDVTELVTCMSSELASYKQAFGPPMVSASPVGDGWVVEMQSAELARATLNSLRQMVLDGVQPSVYLTFQPQQG